ncbi:MAG: hypothetical protein KY462_08085 [Actinobacteria bacterium]|nr:hypothetical protein [Actinomycetota bacterium]
MNAGSRETEAQHAAPNLRLEATVHPGDNQLALEDVADFDLDRIPDPEGGVRVLITADEAVRLVARGYEVHLVRALTVAPLDPALVMDDDSVRAWLEDQVEGIERREGS